MEIKINVRNTDIDVLSSGRLKEKLGEYLNNENINIIFMATDFMLEYAEENQAYQEALKKADLILPHSPELIKEFLMRVGGRERMALPHQWLEALLQYMDKNKNSLYLVGDNEKRMKEFITPLQQQYPQISIAGAYCINPELGPESVINEINGTDADLMLVMMESPVQEFWVADNYLKIHAKLGICIGDMADKLPMGRQKIPMLLKKLHLDRAYHFLKRE